MRTCIYKLHPTYLFVFKCMPTVAHKNSNMLGYDREQTYSFGDLGHLNLEIRIHLNYKQMVYGYSNYQVVEVLKNHLSTEQNCSKSNIRTILFDN